MERLNFTNPTNPRYLHLAHGKTNWSYVLEQADFTQYDFVLVDADFSNEIWPKLWRKLEHLPVTSHMKCRSPGYPTTCLAKHACFSKATNLSCIYASDIPETCAILPHCHKLQHMYLSLSYWDNSGMALTDVEKYIPDIFAIIGKLPAFESLHLNGQWYSRELKKSQGTPLPTDGLRKLFQSTPLTFVKLHSVELDKAAWSVLGNSLRRPDCSLKILKFSVVKGDTDAQREFLEALAVNRSVKSFSYNPKFTEPKYPPVRRLVDYAHSLWHGNPVLSHAGQIRRVADALNVVWNFNPVMCHLELWSGSDDAVQLEETLILNAPAKKLVLHAPDLAVLDEVMTRSSRLQALEITAGDQVVGDFGGFLSTDRSLESLKMDGYEFSRLCRAFWRGLMGNTTLRHLNLSDVQLHTDSVGQLLTVLSDPRCCLHSLSLHHFDVNDDHMAPFDLNAFYLAIVAALRKPAAQLKTLIMIPHYDEEFGIDNCISLDVLESFEDLMANRSLDYLDLGFSWSKLPRPDCKLEVDDDRPMIGPLEFQDSPERFIWHIRMYNDVNKFALPMCPVDWIDALAGVMDNFDAIFHLVVNHANIVQYAVNN